MSSAAVAGAVPAGWLRSPRFDLVFIWAIAAVAVAAGVIAALGPSLFPILLLADLWFLGYHHVVSTFTRLAFDKQSFRQYRFFVLGLPLIVFVATLLLALAVGLWALVTAYLYWQWFHYTRQSWGVSQVYRRKSQLVAEPDWLLKAALYLTPLWGILYRSWQQPDEFLMVEVRTLPVPGVLVDVTGVLALLAFGGFFYVRFRRNGLAALQAPHTQYLASHGLVFLFGYVLINDITFGWLTINVWHNAQYILFVWMFNANRFKNGPEPEARFLSTISQPRHKLRYFATCFGISTAVYLLLLIMEPQIISMGIPSLIVIYQAINFHHYIVDSKIWKVRQRPIQKVLGLAPQP